MLRYGVLLGCLAVLAGCSNVAPTENRDADIQAIKDTEAAWAKDIATRDLEKELQYYADDATVLMAGMAAVAGKDNIRAAFKPLMADPNYTFTFHSTKVEVARSGDIAYSRGEYSTTMTDAKTKQPFTETGHYLTVFRKSASGKWLAVEDISTPDKPANGGAH